MHQNIISKKITIGGMQFLVIDLTQPLALDTKTYPGDPKPQKEIFCDIEKTGYQHHIYKIGDHNFQPHADAPNHQNPELKDNGLEVYDINHCFNRACLIDLSESDDAKIFDGIKYLVEIKKEHLTPYSEQFKGSEAIIIRTGYDRWLEKNKPHNAKNLPYLDTQAASFIASFKNIKVLGVDSLTIDPLGKHFAHQAFKNIMIVESLVHLYEIPKDHRFNFDLQTTPVRIIGATGGPVVAYAFICL